MSVLSVDRCALGLRPLYMRAAMALLEGRVSILSPASPVLVIHCTAAPSSVQCSCAPPLQTKYASHVYKVTVAVDILGMDLPFGPLVICCCSDLGWVWTVSYSW